MNTNLRKSVLLCGFILLLSTLVCASPNTKICRKRNGVFPRPGTSCKGYYECRNFVPVEKKCADGENFDANKGRCEWEDLYPCLEKVKDKECPKENGLFLKPGTNCKKYYRCCNGKAKVESCPSDLLFDPSRGNCEWPDLYTCVESISTTEKISSTVTTYPTSTSSPKTSTDPAIKSSTIQKTTPSNRVTYSTSDPEVKWTNSRIFETSTKFNTQSTPTEGQSTFKTSEPPTISQTITSKISTTSDVLISQSTTMEISTTSEVPTSQSTTMEISTSKVSTSQSSTEISTLQPTSQTSTIQPTSQTSTVQSTSEISLISQTTSQQMSSTYSTDHTILKENKEGDLTTPTTLEVTVSPSTTEVTTSTELNIMCPEPNGYFPHPTDKHKFVGCVSNIAYILTCPSNLVYKHEVRRCERE